jgi:hypothetical protein
MYIYTYLNIYILKKEIMHNFIKGNSSILAGKGGGRQNLNGRYIE